MTTDSERREMARKLRELPDDSTYPDLIGAIADHDGWYAAPDAADRLADLIEPSGHECVPGECPINVRHDNDRIDRDALLALADKIFADTEEDVRSTDLVPAYIAGEILREVARRIREALGVDDG